MEQKIEKEEQKDATEIEKDTDERKNGAGD